jgi:succinate dehydrogenase flavin-adding protein (antitoxin of CptAB toxin-antitoxin module)
MDIQLDDLKELHDFSVRSYNICKSNGLSTLKKILEYQRDNISFKNLKYCGEKSEKELLTICHYHRENGDIIIAPTEKKYDFEYVNNTEMNALLLAFIKNEGNKLKTRTKNTIDNLLEIHEDNVYRLLNYLASIQFKCSRIVMKGIGAQTISELDNFFKKLNIFLDKISEQENNNYEGVKLKFSLFFDKISSSTLSWLENKKELYNRRDFPVFQLIEEMLISNELLDKKRTQILIYRTSYFKTENKSHDDLGKLFDLSRERIRQLSSIEKIVIPFWEKIAQVISIIGRNNFKFPFNIIDNFISVEQFIDENEGLLSNIFYAKFYSLFINNKLKPTLLKNEYFPKYLIDSDLSAALNFDAVWNTVNDLLNEKVEESYTFSLEGFLNSYSNNNINSNWQEIVEVGESFLYQEFEIISDFEKNITIERNTRMQAFDYVYDVLERANIPMHIDDILKEANKFVSKKFKSSESIRSVLTRHSQIFINTSWSTYGLKIWEKEGRYIGGTIRDVVGYFLEKDDKPLHIYTIYNLVKRHRKSSESSLLSNIRADENKRFRFYPNGFIGLSSKEYDETEMIERRIPGGWFHIMKSNFFEGNTSTYIRSEVAKKYAAIYGVSPRLIEVYIQRRVDDKRLIITDEGRIMIQK